MGPTPSPDLVDFIKALRERHGMSIGDVERCLKVPKDTCRHIEKRRRPLPDFQHGLISWLRDFLRCVDATPEEKKEALRLASDAFLRQFEDWLGDL